MDELEPIEAMVRDERLEGGTLLVVRGWPLTVDGLLRNADATRQRFSHRAEPFVAISAEMTVGGWTLDMILAGSRLRTRSSYAAASVRVVTEAGFDVLPTFAAPHCSLVLPAYTVDTAERLREVLGAVRPNPHFVGRRE